MSCEKKAAASIREQKKPKKHTSILSHTGVLSHRRCWKNQTGVFAERTCKWKKTDGQKERLPLTTRSLITLLRTDQNRTAQKNEYCPLGKSVCLSACPSVRPCICHLFRPIECFNLKPTNAWVLPQCFIFFSKFFFLINTRKASKVLAVEETVHPAAASWIHNLVL